MNQQRLSTYPGNSAVSDSGMVIVSHRGFTKDGLCRLAIGSPGLPNLNREFDLGEAVIYETAADGMYEIRFIGSGSDNEIYLLITQIAPSFGLSAGFDTEDTFNSQLSKEEIDRIASSLESAKLAIQSQTQITSEQLEILDQKLHDVLTASSRLGRKDWLMYMAGTLTSLCITASFAPDVSKIIFSQISSSISWLFQNTLRFIQ